MSDNCGRNDSYMELMVDEVIANSSMDYSGYDQWLKSHGFIQTANDDYYFCYMHPRFSFGRYGFHMKVVIYATVFDDSMTEWICCCYDSQSDIYGEVANVIRKILGIEVVGADQHWHQFSLEKSRVRMLNQMMVDWIGSFQVTGDSPEKALRNYCSSVISAMDEIECESKKHNSDYWMETWIR